MKKKPDVFRPRLPEEARKKIKSGGTHKNKRSYDRKKEKDLIRKDKETKSPAIKGGCSVFVIAGTGPTQFRG